MRFRSTQIVIVYPLIRALVWMKVSSVSENPNSLNRQKSTKKYGVHPTEIWAVGHPDLKDIPTQIMESIKDELLALHNQGINIYWSRQGLVYVAGQWVWTAYGVSNFSNWLCQFKKMREVFNYAPVKEGGEWGIEY